MASNTDGVINSRWWESYLVRYLLGTIVGIFCFLFFLKNIFHYPIYRYLKDLGGWYVLSIAIVGFSFCYFSSMPIAVMHYGRFGRSRLESLIRPFWLGLAFSLPLIYIFDGFVSAYVSFFLVVRLLLFGCSFLIIFLFLVCYSEKFIGLKPDSPQGGNICSLGFCCFFVALAMIDYRYVLIAPAFLVGFFQYVVLYRIWAKESDVHDFYVVLVRARSRNGSNDIRDTYTHLREHSNAVFIVVVQLSLFVLLILSVEGARDIRLVSDLVDEDFFVKSVGFVFFWLIPTLFMWGAANRLESAFKKNPMQFLRK